MKNTVSDNHSSLANDLRSGIRGDVRFDSGGRALYSTDSSNYRQVPIGAVIPRDVDDLIETVAACHRHKAPIVHRGAGTSLAGQTTNAAVVIDCSKYLDNIVEVDYENRRARVQPGVRRDQLAAVTEPHGFTFGPDTSTHEYATFGGMIGNNSCGMHSQYAGRTEDNILEIEILTYDGHRMRVGPTSDDELEQIIAEGGRKGDIYRRMRDLRDRHGDAIRERTPDIPRRVSGYSLVELLPENGFDVARALVGSEGTCVTILEATVRLVEHASHRSILVLGYPDIVEAGRHMVEIGEAGVLALEGMDHELIRDMRKIGLHTEYLDLMPEGNGYLIAEFGGDTQEEAHDKAADFAEQLKHGDNPPDIKHYDDADTQTHIWKIRESGLGATARVPGRGDAWEGWEDSAVPPESVGDYLRELRELYDKYGYKAALYGHFGQGCIHTRIDFDLYTAEGITNFRRFLDEAADLCVKKYGGSLSAEHGDGQSRAELLPKMYGEEVVEAFREFKRIWDPDWKMNPGKVVDPNRIVDNLRLGVTYDPPEVETHFQYPDDDHSFPRAVLRCVGVGKCRRHEMEAEDVMCPSFVATHEEKHSTRGRSRLLFEMLNGEESADAWDNEDVKEALDLCLACKGCKSDCPMKVDMATYKAEFLSHYYEKHNRPRSAFALGLIYWWARIASRTPKLANFVTQTPGLSTIAKSIGGVAQERKMPPFAEETFRDWFKKRQMNSGLDKERTFPLPKGERVRERGQKTAERGQKTAERGQKTAERGQKIAERGQKTAQKDQEILLWPDTFTNFFTPDIGKAAVSVLEAAGCRVKLPRQMLCCGRPLYDYGMMHLAKKLWREILDNMKEDIRAGTPLIGLEPSCVAAFRDELINLFPNDEDAKRLSGQTFTLSEFLTNELDNYSPPKLHRKALVHGHCHHKSIMGFDDEKKLFDAMGLDVEMPAASCCGMAGSFGFESEHYDVSIACGEHKLLPSVRDASKETLIVADGFSCREQIEQTTGKKVLHLAQVLELAMRNSGQASAGNLSTNGN